MQLTDFSPPTSPSLVQQGDALRKGLGRATLWARDGKLDDSPLLESCLCDQRYDAQVESSRGNWLWKIILLAGAEDRLRTPILRALGELADDRSAQQICELAFHFAHTGDRSFKSTLYAIVETKPITDAPWLGETEIIQLDGEPAFEFCARERGIRLADDAWNWNDSAFVENAIERFGDETVSRLLENSTDVAIQRFLASWNGEKANRAEQKKIRSHRERNREISLSEILAVAESAKLSYVPFRGWGMYADESDLRIILRQLWTATDPTIISNLLKVFSNRPLPEIDPRHFELCQHDEENVRRCALTSLQKTNHPSIREFALTLLQQKLHTDYVVGLFINNFLPGDEHRILESVELPDDPWEQHGVLMDVIKVLENNPNANSFPLGLVAYCLTPCENCRFDAARCLHRQNATPAWLLEECRFDSNEEFQQLSISADNQQP